MTKMKFTKKTLLAIAVFLSSVAVSQTNVYFEINHKLHGEDFNLNQESFSDMGITFDAKRLQYYISQISVTHDGGQVTEFEDKYILVTANINTNELLGQGTIDSIESISFYIGVDEAANHSDPSTYPSSHPLAFKNPEMHWGWTAGYRFVAMEGDIGPGLENSYNFHALGDDNYFETTVDVGVKAANGTATVSIYANYANALNSLDIAEGMSLHSEIGECITILENFRDYVFTAEAPADTILPPAPVDTVDSTDITFVTELAFEDQISFYPNPAKDEITVVNSGKVLDAKLKVYGISGDLLLEQRTSTSSTIVPLHQLSAGTYVVYIESDAGVFRKVLLLN